MKGVISDWVDPSPGNVYRTHIFTSTGSFAISALSNAYPANVEYLVVAGGGGGASNYSAWGAGGGGAGGFRTNLTGHPLAGSAFPVSTSPGSYSVVVGGGGAGQLAKSAGTDGGNSSFGPITSAGGGGGGGGTPGITFTGRPGGSGGGGTGGGTSDNGGTGNTPPFSPSQGFPGGGGADGVSVYTAGGGGGGATQAGQAAHDLGQPPYAGGYGGAGSLIAITGSAVTYAGGGGGGSNNGPGGVGGAGGGGKGADHPGTSGTPTGAAAGTFNTGGGGGGNSGNNRAESGGSGIVAVRYQIGTTAPNAKATGGAISLYNSKWIHTFVNSGTFATGPTWTSATVEYVVVGGGGGGGAYNDYDGGGGAGAYRTGTTPIGQHPVSTTIQVGGGGIENRTLQNPLPAAYQGTPSYFGTPITSPGGGGGAVDDGASPYPSPAPGEQGMPGGSGGGNAIDNSSSGGPATGAPFPGTIGATPSAGWGHPGGGGSRSPIGGAGGGGAGAAGVGPAPRLGGVGIQLPATFRNPESTVGAPGPTSAPTPNGFDTSGKYWVAGGGDGGQDTSPPFMPTHGSAPGGGGGYWATPSNPVRPGELIGAVQNTGSGGGSANPTITGDPRAGGSGIVIIAYPN